MSNDTSPPRKRGCLFYACLSLIVFALVGVLLAFLAVRYIKTTANRLINDYTDTAPAKIESVEVSKTELNELQKRMAAFKEALDDGKTSRELVLTARDLNILVADNKDIKGKLFVMIDDDRVKGNVSIPLQDIGPLKLKGRYLNGVAALKASLEGGQMVVTLDQVEVKGLPLPPVILSELKKQNFAQNFQNDPNIAATVSKFDSIQIKGGSVILKNKAK